MSALAPTHNILAVMPRELFLNEILPRLPSRDLRNFSETCKAAHRLTSVEHAARVGEWVGVPVLQLPSLPHGTSWSRLAGGMSNMNEHTLRVDGDIPSMLVASAYLSPLFEQDLVKWVDTAPSDKEEKYQRAATIMRVMKEKVDEGYVPRQLSGRELNARRWQTMWGNRPGAQDVAEAEKVRIMETLDLSDLDLESLPAIAIACLRNVMRVNLNNNAFEEVPKELFRLPVYELQIEHNRIKKLPEDLHRLRILALLAVSGNPLDYVPECIKNMSLKSIAVGFGQLSLFRGVMALIGSHLVRS